MTINSFKNKVSIISDRTESESVKELLSLFKDYICSSFEGFDPPYYDAVRFKDTDILYQTDRYENKPFQPVEREKEEYYTEPERNDFFKKLLKLFRKSKEEETFSDTLIRLMRERKMSGPATYRRAGIDARHFSKIISNRDYHPGKDTVLAFAIALKLNLEETVELMNKAGLSFSPSSLFDLSIKFFIENGCYDRKTIDSLMQELDLPLLPQNWS